jgi:hypothetical protein
MAITNWVNCMEISIQVVVSMNAFKDLFKNIAILNCIA